MATDTRSSTSVSESQDSDPFEVAVQRLITINKASKTPITLEAMVPLLRAQGFYEDQWSNDKLVCC